MKHWAFLPTVIVMIITTRKVLKKEDIFFVLFMWYVVHMASVQCVHSGGGDDQEEDDTMNCFCLCKNECKISHVYLSCGVKRSEVDVMLLYPTRQLIQYIRATLCTRNTA